jgi:hypothetical protein
MDKAQGQLPASRRRPTRQHGETTAERRQPGVPRPQARPGVPFVPVLRVTTPADLLAMMGRDPDPDIPTDSARQ